MKKTIIILITAIAILTIAFAIVYHTTNQATPVVPQTITPQKTPEPIPEPVAPKKTPTKKPVEKPKDEVPAPIQIITTPTTIQQQITINNPPPAQSPPASTPPPADTGPKQTDLQTLGVAVTVSNIHSDYGEIDLYGLQRDDKATLTFDGHTYTNEGASIGAMGFSLAAVNRSPNPWETGYALTPDTAYDYQVKIERDNVYAVISGNFRTLP